MLASVEFEELQTLVGNLDANDIQYCRSVCRLRDQIDDAYARRLITLHQWRVLMEEVSMKQARYAITRQDGWRCGLASR